MCVTIIIISNHRAVKSQMMLQLTQKWQKILFESRMKTNSSSSLNLSKSWYC